jgi:hypothetical protein
VLLSRGGAFRQKGQQVRGTCNGRGTVGSWWEWSSADVGRGGKVREAIAGLYRSVQRLCLKLSVKLKPWKLFNRGGPWIKVT